MIYKKRTLVVLAICLAILFWVVTWFACNGARRPLFHDRYTSEHSYELPFLPTWVTISPVADWAGVIGYVDDGLNMFVVVVTDDKDIVLYWTHIEASSSEAVLLVGTPYEARVRAKQNTLVIIENGESLSFPIEPGEARQWHRDLIGLTSDPGWTVLGEIARKYHGERKEVIEEMAARVANRASIAP